VRLAPLLSAALTAAAMAGAVLLGARLGPPALALCLPAAVAAGLLAHRRQARERRLRALSREDPLTGLGNARLLRERLAYELARHARHRRPMTVLVLDLDGFKAVNDRFGHAAGDEVLRGVAGALAQTVRDQDTVVRQGGDEFCVLAPETGRAEAEALAARMQAGIHGAVVGVSGLGASFGAAVFPEDGVHGAALLAFADAEAREAKRRARRARARRAAA
jgi:diguanylate cyclase (GGDEF)-like protein